MAARIMKRKLLLCSVLAGLLAGSLAAQEPHTDGMTERQETPAAAEAGLTPEEAARKAKEERWDLMRKIFGYFFLTVLIVWMFWPKKRHEEELEDLEPAEDETTDGNDEESRS